MHVYIYLMYAPLFLFSSGGEWTPGRGGGLGLCTVTKAADAVLGYTWLTSTASRAAEQGCTTTFHALVIYIYIYMCIYICIYIRAGAPFVALIYIYVLYIYIYVYMYIYLHTWLTSTASRMAEQGCTTTFHALVRISVKLYI